MQKKSTHYPPRFLKSITSLLKHEGGYVHDPADPGGETKYGISKRTYPMVNIKTLTKDQAIAIYYEDWWVRYNYDDVPAPMDQKIFDAAVNMGARPAHLYAQRALRACGYPVVEDGVIGRETLTALKAVEAGEFLAAFRAEMAGHYRRLAERRPVMEKFLGGWLKRAYS